jgi:hypothetical protein
VKDIGRRHRPMERERFPRARARHLRSRAASEQRPAGTMTGLRGARWTGTGNSASQEARPSGAELRRWLAAASAAVERRQAARRADFVCADLRTLVCVDARRAPASVLPRKRWRMKAGARRLEIRVCRRSASFFLVARMKRSEMRGRRCKPRDRSRIFAEPVIGPATSGRTRWLRPGYRCSSALRIGLCCT